MIKGQPPKGPEAVEERLKELIREGNGCCKDLMQMIRLTREVIRSDITKIIDEQVRDQLAILRGQLEVARKKSMDELGREVAGYAHVILGDPLAEGEDGDIGILGIAQQLAIRQTAIMKAEEVLDKRAAELGVNIYVNVVPKTDRDGNDITQQRGWRARVSSAQFGSDGEDGANDPLAT